jgi:hypothetical protein
MSFTHKHYDIDIKKCFNYVQITVLNVINLYEYKGIIHENVISFKDVLHAFNGYRYSIVENDCKDRLIIHVEMNSYTNHEIDVYFEDNEKLELYYSGYCKLNRFYFIIYLEKEYIRLCLNNYEIIIYENNGYTSLCLRELFILMSNALEEKNKRYVVYNNKHGKLHMRFVSMRDGRDFELVTDMDYNDCYGWTNFFIYRYLKY